MNTATRAVSSHAISFSAVSIVSWLLEHLWLIVIMLSLFASAIGIVYAKDLNRRLFIQAQSVVHENVAAKERWSKLILEQSTLAQQDRLHRIAASMDMVAPGKQVVRVVKG